MWRTEKKKFKKWKNFVSCKSRPKITIFQKKKFFKWISRWRSILENQLNLINHEAIGYPLWRSISVSWLASWRTNWIRGTLVLQCGDPKKKVLNLHFKIKGLQLENQIIQVIYVVQYQYTGLSVGEPTDPVEPWFSTVEIQKIRFKIYISISRVSNWRTKLFRGSM